MLRIAVLCILVLILMTFCSAAVLWIGVVVASIIDNCHILACENSIQKQYDTAFVRIFYFK